MANISYEINKAAGLRTVSGWPSLEETDFALIWEDSAAQRPMLASLDEEEAARESKLASSWEG